jgi:hypothetical protein
MDTYCGHSHKLFAKALVIHAPTEGEFLPSDRKVPSFKRNILINYKFI